MKKIISLILAFIMIMSLGVMSFAVNAVKLTPVEPDTKELIVLDPLEMTGENESIFIAGEGGTFFVMLDTNIEYTKMTVEATGCVTAKVVEYDPEIYAPIDGLTYRVTKKYDKDYVEDYGMTYEDAKELAKKLNHDNKTTIYIVRPDVFVNIFEVTIDDNFTPYYKEGKVIVKAFNKTEDRNEKATLKIVRDVVIFDAETVEYCAINDHVLHCGEERGYSDYETAKKGYKDMTITYDLDPTVVSAHAFHKIADKNLTVENKDMLVKMFKVANNQKSINFAAHGVKEVDTNKDDVIDKITFGFYDKTPIMNKFEITVDTGYNYFTLREAFKIRLEENDVIKYTVLKDSKFYSEFVVDYAKEDPTTQLKFIIDGAAGETLGEYEIIVGEAPEVKETTEEEENPNTGAPAWYEIIWYWLFG